ncbi:hypothetical protein RFI_12075 [Reticulomyxa filosa]|uniref:Uncharacterized protein n=1 Tax=Reticulomyxa filosa TaxID=46433 RepID=X6NGN4_RETFI|nr:hypothetical protein RFI_12075 [Reticulomyxa filosa]|eukprot:ETO25068.1 hypothetical protein RFI_12075 [Reticulomyxa filosa]
MEGENQNRSHNTDPFDVSTFLTNPNELCRILLLPASVEKHTMEITAENKQSNRFRVELTTPFYLLGAVCRLYDHWHPVAGIRLIQLLSFHQQASTKQIAYRALQSLSAVKNGLTTLPDVLINKKMLPIPTLCKQTKKNNVRDFLILLLFKTIHFSKFITQSNVYIGFFFFFFFKTENKAKQDFELFEQRILFRVILCNDANRYYEMLDFLLLTPLTISRLRQGIETYKKSQDWLTPIQKANIFKRLLTAWIEVKVMNYEMSKKKQFPINERCDQYIHLIEEFIDIGSDWIEQLRPNGYNGFHFMEFLAKEMLQRKVNKMKRLTKKLQSGSVSEFEKEEYENKEVELMQSTTTGNVDILASDGDIPVSALKPVLLLFAKELQPLT